MAMATACSAIQVATGTYAIPFAVLLAMASVALVLNIMSMQASVVLGNVLYVILLTVSVPMFCCGFWALSLFLWAVLFMSTFPKVLGGLLKKP